MEAPQPAKCDKSPAFDPCSELTDDLGADLHARLISGAEIGMGRILMGMVAFGLAVGVLFPWAVAPWIEWRTGQETKFRLACVAAGLLVGGFAYGVARLTLYRTNQRLAAIAVVDPLTGLSNHRQFVQLLRAELCRANRQGHPVTLVVADLDHFKRINDDHGHLTGNAVLSLVGRTLLDEVRQYDSACRIGGEEFAIILPEVDRKSAVDVAERIRTTLASKVHDDLPRITASLGLASFPQDARSSTELVKKADDAMYRAKAAGRNRTMAWTDPAAITADAAPSADTSSPEAMATI